MNDLIRIGNLLSEALEDCCNAADAEYEYGQDCTKQDRELIQAWNNALEIYNEENNDL